LSTSFILNTTLTLPLPVGSASLRLISFPYGHSRVPDFYRHVLVFTPFTATGLGLFTLSAFLLLEHWHKWRKSKENSTQVSIFCVWSIFSTQSLHWGIMS